MASHVSRSLNGAHARLSGKQILGSLLALLVLTGLSWGLAYVSLGAAGPAFALGIAAVKATIVALFFMELIHGTIAQRVVLTVTVALLLLLCFGVVGDVAFR